jgi:hypothetical protein
MQLDLSINRLSGSLGSDLFVSQHSQVYDLSVNRLSGHTKCFVFFLRCWRYKCLGGNLFGCQQGNIPQSDVKYGAYQCGSVDFQYSPTAWSAGFVLSAVVVAFGSDWMIKIVDVFRSSEAVRILVGPLCCLVICLVGLVGL